MNPLRKPDPVSIEIVNWTLTRRGIIGVGVTHPDTPFVKSTVLMREYKMGELALPGIYVDDNDNPTWLIAGMATGDSEPVREPATVVALLKRYLTVPKQTPLSRELLKRIYRLTTSAQFYVSIEGTGYMLYRKHGTIEINYHHDLVTDSMPISLGYELNHINNFSVLGNSYDFLMGATKKWQTQGVQSYYIKEHLKRLLTRVTGNIVYFGIDVIVKKASKA